MRGLVGEDAVADSGRHRVEAAADQGAASTSEGPDDFASRRSTYHLDDLDLSVPEQVDDLELPPKSIGDAFVDAYFTTVHPCFPFLSKSRFLQVYEQCFEAYGTPIGRRWRAMLNLVFAIGAKFSVLIKAESSDERDHLIFFTRARGLSLDDGALWQVGDLEQVQLLVLTVLYLTAADHTNRWGRRVPCAPS